MYNSFDEIQMDMEYLDLSTFEIDALFLKRREILKWRRLNRADVNMSEVDAYVTTITTEIASR